MPKVGVNVGEEFPAEEVEQPEGGSDDTSCSDSEEWRRRHAERHAKARAFKDDIRSAVKKHFGEHAFTAHNVIVLRALLAVTFIALVLAVVPGMLLLGIVLSAIAFFVFKHHRHDHWPHEGAH